jgi:RNA polymerase sigma factor (sigma-70 family)
MWPVEQGEPGRLVKAAAQGDEAAWRELVERFSGLVWAVARGFRLNTADASDVYQTVWLRLAEHLGRIQSPDQVGAWLATTARRESIRVVRGRRRTTPIEDSALADLIPADEISPERTVLQAEQARLEADRAKHMWRAFRDLPARCQQLLRILMASHRPSYAEAAAALDVPVGSIGPTRARCLRQLRRLMGEVSGSESQARTKKRDQRGDDRAGRA